MAKQNSVPVEPASFELVVSFDEEWPDDPNALYADPHNRLFLCEAKGFCDIVIRRGDAEIPLVDSQPSDFKQVTLKRACAWYGKLERYSRGGAGSASLLCKLAAERLKD